MCHAGEETFVITKWTSAVVCERPLRFYSRFNVYNVTGNIMRRSCRRNQMCYTSLKQSDWTPLVATCTISKYLTCYRDSKRTRYFSLKVMCYFFASMNVSFLWLSRHFQYMSTLILPCFLIRPFRDICGSTDIHSAHMFMVYIEFLLLHSFPYMRK